MAKIGHFVANDLPKAEFGAIPAGSYHVGIDKASVHTTKAGNGEYLKLELRVVSGQYAGRKLFCNINIRNESEKAQEIGLQQFGTLLRSIGLAVCDDTDQLIGKECEAKVAVDPVGEQNQIKFFRELDTARPPTGAVPSTAPSTGKAPPPWAKK